MEYPIFEISLQNSNVLIQDRVPHIGGRRGGAWGAMAPPLVQKGGAILSFGPTFCALNMSKGKISIIRITTLIDTFELAS